jgi:hypothetical protein
VRDRNAYQFKRHAIQNCLYGVDIDPGAVEIAKLRLWLSLVVDEDDVQQIKPLPNLDYKVVVGNSLLGVKKNLFNTEQFKQLEALKPKLFDESNQTKKAEYKRQGSPKQTQEMKEARVYHARRDRGNGWFKYLQGSDVCRYSMAWSGEYIKYGDNLAAPRRDFRLYSTKRILVRQIPSKLPYCLHACFTKETILNDRNSMNVINLKAEPLAILAVLNSRLVSFWFALKFGKLQRGLFPQFKANELADFPIPKKLSIFEARLAALAAKATEARLKNATANIVAIDHEIDLLVCSAFEVEPDDMELIEAKTAVI